MSEELIVRHCSPTLANIKTGSLFTCPLTSRQEILEDIRQMNRRLVPRGLRMLPLRFSAKKVLIYIYRPRGLAKDLANGFAARLLSSHGYRPTNCAHCVTHLIRRLQEQEEFPHEIGLFLGYPPEDVQGFIENRAGSCKCVGSWKVYGDEEAAQKLFARYKKCTRLYCDMLAKGKPIERLAVCG